MSDKRISAARIREVWLDESINGTEAARRVGLSRVNLWLRAKALGLPKRKTGRPHSIPPRLFRAMWEGGVRAQEIADAFGRPLSSVEQTARRAGLGRRPHGSHCTLEQWRERQRQIALANLMAADAKITRAEMIRAEMVDAVAGRRRA